ncbi:MAG: Uncharacterised protein [Methanobacteriota archaeon]|nr:MAG: Uncharacterised protein [Euryarchaeota archaeon]
MVHTLNTFTSDHPNLPVPWSWPEDTVRNLASKFREALFPVHIAANKADLAEPKTWLALKETVEIMGGLIQATSAETELALRRASKAGAIDYRPGDNCFSIHEDAEINDAQRKGIDALQKRIEVLGGTGVVALLSAVVFNRLDRIVAYPVQDESKWLDGEGRILPDALLVKRGATAKHLAYAVHTDLGDGFIRATDARSGRVIGADHELADNDVVKIHAKT